MKDHDAGGMDILEIMEYLPHRYPMLLIDQVTEFVPEKSIRGLKNVTMNEPFFPGHFPGFPVMPGVLVIEALAQAAAILTYRTTGTPPDGDSLFFFAGIDNARFRRQVVPGDTLILDINLVRIVRGVGKFNSRAMVGDDMAAEADLMAVLRPVIRARPGDRGA